MLILPPTKQQLAQQRNWNLLILKGAITNLAKLVRQLPVVREQKELLAILSRAEYLLKHSIEASYKAQKSRLEVTKTGDSQLT